MKIIVTLLALLCAVPSYASVTYKRVPADTCHCPRATVKTPVRRHSVQKRVSARPGSNTAPSRTTWRTVKDTIYIEKQPIYRDTERLVYREPVKSLEYLPEDCAKVIECSVGPLVQTESDNYPNMAGGFLELARGRWSTRLSFAGNGTTELGLDVLYHFPKYLYVGGGVLAEWSVDEWTTYLVTTTNTDTGEKKDEKKQSHRKKHSKRSSKRDKHDKEDIVVTVSVISRTTSRTFDLSPSLTIGAQSPGQLHVFGEGRMIFADKERTGLRAGLGYTF